MKSNSQPESAKRSAASSALQKKNRYSVHNGGLGGKRYSALTRRQALKVLGSGALLVATGPVTARAASEISGKPSKASPALEAFPLTDVRLLEGPFLEAQ